MTDKSPRKERVFGEPPNDPKPRMQGKDIVYESMAQSVGPMDMQMPSTMRKRMPGTGNLTNN